MTGLLIVIIYLAFVSLGLPDSLLYERGVGDGRVCVNLPQAKEMIEEILS